MAQLAGGDLRRAMVRVGSRKHRNLVGTDAADMEYPTRMVPLFGQNQRPVMQRSRQVEPRPGHLGRVQTVGDDDQVGWSQGIRDSARAEKGSPGTSRTRAPVVWSNWWACLSVRDGSLPRGRASKRSPPCNKPHRSGRALRRPRSSAAPARRCPPQFQDRPHPTAGDCLVDEAVVSRLREVPEKKGLQAAGLGQGRMLLRGPR